jgi:hypothetical protein
MTAQGTPQKDPQDELPPKTLPPVIWHYRISQVPGGDAQIVLEPETPLFAPIAQFDYGEVAAGIDIGVESVLRATDGPILVTVGPSEPMSVKVLGRLSEATGSSIILVTSRANEP